MVKLKPAKRYLKEYYLVENDEIAFQENDIMLAAAYLRSLRIKYDMPLVIVLGLGVLMVIGQEEHRGKIFKRFRKIHW